MGRLPAKEDGEIFVENKDFSSRKAEGGKGKGDILKNIKVISLVPLFESPSQYWGRGTLVQIQIIIVNRVGEA